MRLRNGIALVTGGGTGIGASIAELFAAEGAKVMVAGRRESVLAATVDTIKASGHTAAFVVMDVRDADQVRNAVGYTLERFGGLDALVSAAGVITRVEQPPSFDEEKWTWIMDTNTKGVFLTTKYALEPMLHHPGPNTIVNIASISAHRSFPGYATYSASKGAVLSYTRVIAAQYGPQVRANCISPGIVRTPISDVDFEDFASMIPDLNEKHPLKRIGQPKDIAYAALFLTSDESAWITGQDLIVDGGLTLSV